ncbi:pimeloyl-ACP methyl ester carboxylesterase [Chryseobacterium ginsenosidimutans]|uniref:alpha/beta fold hydrolase n=1 Tax=Chryseobacterium ginsenosidimutans TaxID=687846 RepID=UPI0021698D4F|nr:alpha/beta hydrolase [Chryseobacterium ginsenosidimutans]MCS3868756.1 pimeloyl-ACP methyl ester carboxylesterase [Chryseobacterium ginsenosidimutans]
MEGRIIDVQSKKLYIESNNSFENKPTIVFLHDSLGCTQLWRDFPAKLAEATGCNVLVYDRLGYGKSFPMLTHERENNYMESEADLLNDLLNELNIKDAILFGHSDGGTIALITASKYPGKVKATICEAGHIFVEDVTVKGVKDAFEAYKTTDLPERLQKYHGDKVEMMVKAWTEIWLSDRFRSWNIEYVLKNITSPLLFIQGESDDYGTLDQLEKTISQVGGIVEKFIIPNVGHTPHKEVSGGCFRKIY